MPIYTTGELAKLCGITVRTVQYYDARNILAPSQLSEGGRRLYSEEDLQKLKIICFLRDLDLPITSIGQLLSQEHPEKVIALLCKQQEDVLKAQITRQQEQLSKLDALQKEVRSTPNFSVESIADIVYIMENRKKLRSLRCILLAVGIPLEILELSTLILGICTGIWWPYLLGMAAVIGGSVWISLFYFKRVAYICPECHTVFKPRFWDVLFARHTPNTRRLTCTACGYKGYCVETADKTEE